MNTLKCPNCNALLSHPTEATTITCEFCGFKTHIKPPTAARPVINRPAPMPYSPASSAGRTSGKGCLLIIFGVLVLAGSFLAVALKSGSFQTRLPATTELNETITLENKTETIAGVAINADGANAKIIIRNCNLKAEKLLVATQPNVEITIENSRIETSDNTFELGLNPKIHISKKSIISSRKGTVIKGGQNVELTLTNSRMVGARYGVDMGNNGKFVLEGESLLQGDRGAIKGEHNIQLEMLAGSAIVSKATALTFQYNGRVKIEDATLTGDVAVEADSNFELTMISGKIVGNKTGLALTTNGKIMMEGGEINGSEVGILANQTLKLKMEGGTIKGRIAIQCTGESGSNEITIKGGTIKGSEVGIQYEKRGVIKLEGGTVEGQIAIQVPEYSQIKLSGGSVIGTKVGIDGKDRLTIEGSKGTIKGGEFAIVKGEYGSLPDKTVVIDGAIKENKPDRPHIPAGIYINGKRVM